MKRCVLVIPDAGPLNSLWVADRLDLLLRLDMPIVIVDAAYDEVTSDLRYPKDAAVKAFIEANQPPFVIEQTDIGAYERARRRAGKPRKRNIGELAMMDFISDAGGVRRYLQSNDPLLMLYEDRGLRVFQRPPNMHLLSTVGLLRGMEKVGVIRSADAIISEMTNPTKPGRRPQDGRGFSDLPDGVDEPAADRSLVGDAAQYVNRHGSQAPVDTSTR